MQNFAYFQHVESGYSCHCEHDASCHMTCPAATHRNKAMVHCKLRPGTAPARRVRLVLARPPSSRTGYYVAGDDTTLQLAAGVASRRHRARYTKNMTSSTKPEVHDVLQRRQKRTEPRPTCTENFVKLGRVVREICSRADRETDRHTHRNSPLPYTGAE